MTHDRSKNTAWIAAAHQQRRAIAGELQQAHEQAAQLSGQIAALLAGDRDSENRIRQLMEKWIAASQRAATLGEELRRVDLDIADEHEAS